MFSLHIGRRSKPSLLHCVLHVLRCKTQGPWSVRFLVPKAASTAPPWLLKVVNENQVFFLGPVINNRRTASVVARDQCLVCIS